MKPRILMLDIETAPTTAYVWGLFKQNVGMNQIIKPGYTISWAAKWYGEKQVMHSDLPTDGNLKMLQKIHTLLDDADIVVHWNGTSFDIPTLYKEFIKAGMKPPAPFLELDLMLTAKKKFRFQSNKFDFVLKELGIGSKIDTGGFELWAEWLNGDPKAWKKMKEYNIHDTKLLEPMYDRMKPWIANHPNVNNFNDVVVNACPSCGGLHLEKRGFYHTPQMRYQRYRCNDCGAWSRSPTNNLIKAARKARLVGAR